MVEVLEQLAAGEAHVYTARVAAALEPGFVEACLRDLGPQEQDRYRRFLLDRDRWPFLVARCLVRRALSRYAPVSPGAWTFDAGGNGKPRIAGPDGAPALTFNISNTHGLAVCIVALDRAVGIDVEDVDRDPGVLDLTDRCLAPREARRVVSAPPSLRVRRFLEHWTLKEAYLKARGTGLSTPPELVSFDLETVPVRLHLDRRVGDLAERWWFLRDTPTQRHILAAAVERSPDTEPRVRLIAGTFLLA